jgi:plastocyanin
LEESARRVAMHRYAKSALLAAVALAIGSVAAGLESQSVAAGGGCRGMSSTEASGDVVRMEGTCFLPTVLQTTTGSTVTWANDSDLPHNVAGATTEWGNYNELQQGQEVGYTFDKSGTYPYYCFVHNGMIGAIVVSDGQVERSQSGEVAQVAASGDPGTAFAPSQSAVGNEPKRERHEAWFASLGAIIGATLVAVGFGIRELRGT